MYIKCSSEMFHLIHLNYFSLPAFCLLWKCMMDECQWTNVIHFQMDVVQVKKPQRISLLFPMSNTFQFNWDGSVLLMGHHVNVDFIFHTFHVHRSSTLLMIYEWNWMNMIHVFYLYITPIMVIHKKRSIKQPQGVFLCPLVNINYSDYRCCEVFD